VAIFLDSDVWTASSSIRIIYTNSHITESERLYSDLGTETEAPAVVVVATVVVGALECRPQTGHTDGVAGLCRLGGGEGGSRTEPRSPGGEGGSYYAPSKT
jgi:hypothetical protein